jgi:hypothetical protein
MSRSSSFVGRLGLVGLVGVLVGLLASPARAWETPPVPVSPDPTLPAPAAPADAPASTAPPVESATAPAPPAPPPAPVLPPQAGDIEQPTRLRQRTGSPPPPHSKKPMYVGLCLLGASYVVTVIASLGAFGGSGGLIQCTNCAGAGGRMMVPVMGPWIALPNLYGRGTVVAALLGTAQAAGLVIAIIGGVHAAQPPVADEPDGASPNRPAAGKGQTGFGVSFLLLPTQDGAFGVASGRF